MVEVDGAPHTEEVQARRDLARTRWLEARGLRVIRFWNIEVFTQPNEVAEAIYQRRRPPFDPLRGPPSPQGGKQSLRNPTASSSLLGDGGAGAPISAAVTEWGPSQRNVVVLLPDLRDLLVLEHAKAAGDAPARAAGLDDLVDIAA